jgi:hypothetical protein
MRGNTYEMPSIYRKNATICKHMYLFTHSVTYYGFTPSWGPTSRHSTMDVRVTYMIMLHDQQQRVHIRTKYKKRNTEAHRRIPLLLYLVTDRLPYFDTNAITTTTTTTIIIIIIIIIIVNIRTLVDYRNLRNFHHNYLPWYQFTNQIRVAVTQLLHYNHVYLFYLSWRNSP